MIYLVSSCARQSLRPALTRRRGVAGNVTVRGRRLTSEHTANSFSTHTNCSIAIEKEVSASASAYSSDANNNLDPRLLLAACISIGSLLQYNQEHQQFSSMTTECRGVAHQHQHRVVAATSMAHQLASVSAAHHYNNAKEAVSASTNNNKHKAQYGDYVWTMNVNDDTTTTGANKMIQKQQFASRTTTTCTSADPAAVQTDDPAAAYRHIIPEQNKKQTVLVSVRALRGGRFHMEDEYFIGDNGRFVGVFDGHGGGGVSSYLREQLHAAFQKYLGVIDCPKNKSPSIGNCIAALRAAFNEVDTKVLLDDDLKDQGSTAVCCILHKDVESGKKTLLSANVGDSRAVLSRNKEAIDLTDDHKPGNRKEYARIKELGGEREIEYDYAGGFYRVGNLSVSRAIGDRFARPFVSGQVDIKQMPVQEENDEFIVLASDGLYDVMSSQGVVNFVHEKLQAPLPDGFPCLEEGGNNNNNNQEMYRALMDQRRRKVSKFLAKEAVRRGSMDNICVVIVWLKSNGEGEELSAPPSSL